MGRGFRSLHPLWCYGWSVSVLRSKCESSHVDVYRSSGWLLWKVFMNMDSFEFPAKNYGDLAYRTYGKYFRWLVNSTQALQLLLSVGNIIISNGYVPFPCSPSTSPAWR